MNGADIIKPTLEFLCVCVCVVALVALAYGCGPDVETLVRSFR